MNSVPTNGRVDHEYRRDTARIEAAEQFERLKTACTRAGGVVHIYRQSSGRFPPTTMEMRQASCAARPGSGI